MSSRVRTCPAPWGMSAQEHTFTFCQIFFISGGNYTLITCIQYTTMVTHSECEISQSWRTQFSSHGALNLNRAVMPPPSPTSSSVLLSTYPSHLSLTSLISSLICLLLFLLSRFSQFSLFPSSITTFSFLFFLVHLLQPSSVPGSLSHTP